MAGVIAKVFRTSSIYVANLQGLQKYAVVSICCQRNLYGDAFLSIDDYVSHRDKISMQYHGMKEKFTERMKKYMESERHGLVFTEDLKHLVHLAENKPEDLDLIVEMLKKYSTQNQEMRFSRYVFGPVVMRLLHHLNLPDLANEILQDEALVGLFDQITSYTLAMNLLYKNGKYQQVIDLFDKMQRQPIHNKFPRDPFVLLMAACYKLNTPETLKLTVKRLHEAKEVDALVLRKAVTFAAALALKQNNPEQAMEMLNITPQANYFTVKNLKVVALTQMNRLEDALRLLKHAAERDAPMLDKKPAEFSEETLSIVKEAIDLSQNKEHALLFQRIEQALRELKIVATESLDESICSPILNKPPPRKDSRVVGFESQFFVPNLNRGDRPLRERQNYGMRPRHGLTDYD